MQGGCSIWTAYKTSDGYGLISVQGKCRLAHRTMYELHHNIILEPKDKILHDCDNPSCIEPNHLVKGTQKQNMQSMVEKRRIPLRFTDDEVKTIRRRAAEGPRGIVVALATEFGVSQPYMTKLIRGAIYKHIK